MPSGCSTLSHAIVAIAGMPPRHLGWAQLRSFGAAALELCAVADGLLDGFVVGSHAALASWDYLGALLVCTEAGAAVGELHGRELVTTDTQARRAVVAAATPGLLDQLGAAWRAAPPSAPGASPTPVP